MPFIATKYAALIYEVNQVSLRNAAMRNSTRYTYTKYGNKLLFKVTNSQLSIALNKGLIDANIEVYNDDLTPIQDFFKMNSIRRVNGRTNSKNTRPIRQIQSPSSNSQNSVGDSGTACWRNSETSGEARADNMGVVNENTEQKTTQSDDRKRVTAMEDRQGTIHQSTGASNRKRVYTSERRPEKLGEIFKETKGAIDGCNSNTFKSSTNSMLDCGVIGEFKHKDILTNNKGELNANNKENSSDIGDNALNGKHDAGDRGVGARIYDNNGCDDVGYINGGESKGARELKLSTSTAILTAKGLKPNSSSKASNTNETSTLNECLNERNAVGNYALLNTPKEELAAANEKAIILSKIEQRVANNESIKSICNELNISRMQYYRMLKAYKTQGLAGLLDKRTTTKVNSKIGEIIPDVLKTLALDLWRGFGAGGCDYAHLHNLLHAHAYKLLNYDYKGYLDNKTNELFSVKTLQAFIENYKKQNYLEALVVEKGLDKAKSYAQPSMGNQRQAVKYRNEKWQIDSSPLDMILRDSEGNEFRPHILSVIDVFSGRCVAMLSDTSNALSLVRLLWKAIDTMGLPECIKGDNGKDYLSNHFQSVLNKLGIFYENTPAYSGELKAFVERHFKTMQHSFIANSAGAIGHDLCTRQTIEQRTPKKERTAKNKFGKIKKTNQTDLLNLDEAKQLLENAVNYWNLVSNKRVKNRKSRIDVWNESNTELIKVTYDYFLARAGEYVAKKVQKKGININSRTYISADMPSVGTSIKVVTNIDNISEVYVYDEKFNFLCIAYDNTTANLSAEQYKEHKKAFNKELQAINKVIKDVNVGEFTRTTLEIEKKVLRELNEEKLSDTNFTILDDKSKKNYKEKGKLLKEVSSCLDYTAPKIKTIDDEDEMSYEDLIKNSKIG